MSIRLCATLLLGLSCAWVGAAAAEPGTDVQLLHSAERSDDAGTQATVALPDDAALGEHDAGPLRRGYHWNLRLDAPVQDQALYLSGLRAHARITVNGNVVQDTLALAAQPVPRSVDKVVLVNVPDAFWRVGMNGVDIEAMAPRQLSISPLAVGPRAELAQRQRWRQIGAVVGPAIVAAVVGTLGLCMLLLWSMLREPLYGYFGAGTLGWALHSAWTAWPWTPLTGEHLTVWWTSLYTFFVAMLVVFCARSAGWRWPRFERAVWATALLGPAVLYLSWAFGALDPASEAWRLLTIALVAVGVAANVRAALRLHGTDSALVALTGLVCLAFATHDWLTAHGGADNNPVYWVPYAGLMFVVVVVRMLIVRLVGATRDIRHLNADLERRVAAQNAELRDALDKMREARDRAEAADRGKTNFMAMASHDLAQPAQALGLYLASLRRDGLDSDQVDVLRRMTAALAALNTMFHALLDISRLDAGEVELRRRPFAVVRLLRRLAEEFAPQAEAAGLRLALHVPADANAVLAASDPLHVERIVRNLLANAVKYTQQGGVLLACRARGAAPAAHWRVEVWDTGIGIAAPDRERVFEEFFQVDNAGRDRSRGLGLGLAIVQRLVGVLGLKLELSSRLGRGSCFALQLPMAQAQDAARLAVTATRQGAPRAPMDGLRVAVIDDDHEVRGGLALLLRGWGCQVIEGATAVDILDGLHLLGGALPQALLVDYRLGDGRTGPAEVQVLFAHWRLAVPVLVVTGESTPRALQDIRASGCALLQKPVSPLPLRHWLEGVAASPLSAHKPAHGPAHEPAHGEAP